ncbi:MAG: hypothetical protein KAG97_12400, partial [Victivallales bacterium]|nr:hypothetical protein [Victivallales bacterium]
MEATGIAEPKDISALKETEFLERRYGESVCVTVVDAVNFLKLSAILPALTAQVAAADLLLLNKTDLADEETVDEVERRLRSLNSHAKITKTANCAFDFDLDSLLASKKATAIFADSPNGALATAPPSDVEKCELRLDYSPKRIAFYDFLDKYRNSILRGKGVVDFGGSAKTFVEVVNGSVTSRPAGNTDFGERGFKVAMSFVLHGTTSIEFKNAAAKLKS